ncbi:hypothetical protein CDD83_6094 [Cordyceps sp. RAO-2017]|nr:hypothetical protein CDD83_6094 [Cordyceps sp. RAO-2017]
MTDVGQRSRGYCSFEDKREHGTDEDFRNACKCLIGKELAEKKAEQTTTTTTTTAATESTTSLTTSAVDTTTTSAVTEKTEPTTSLTTSSTTSALNTTTTAAVPEQTESTTSLTTSAVNTTTTSAVPEKTDSTTSLTTSLTTSALNASTTAAVPEKTDSTTSVTTSAVNATTTSSNGQKPTDVTTSVPAGTTTAASGSASQTGTQTTSTQTGTKATTLAPAQTSGTVVPGQKIDQIRVEAFFTFLNNDCKFEIIAGIVVPVIPAEWHDVAYSVYFCLKIKVVGDKEGKRNFEPCEARFHARVVSDIHGHLIDGHVVKYTDLSGSVEAVCVSGGVYVKVRVSIGGGQPTISETDKKAAGPGADLIDQCTGRSCSRVPGNTNVDIRFNIGPASRVPAGAAAPARNSFGLQIRISVVQCQSQQCGAIQRCLDDKCVTQTPAVGFVANVSVSIGNVRPATIESEAKCVEEIEKPAGSNGVAGKTLSGKVTVIVKAIDAVKPKICKPRPAGSKAQPKVEKPKAESNEAVPNQDVRINIAAGQDNKEKSVPSTQPEQPAQQSTTTSQRTKQETTNSKTTTETTSKQEGQNKETTTTVKLAPVDRPAAVNNTQTGPSSESGSQAPSKSGNQAPSSESGSQGPSKAPSSESGSAGPSKIPSESGSAGPSKDQDKSSPASPASPARVNSGEERPSSGSPAGGNPPSGASGASSGRPGQSQASSESDVEPATRMGGSSSGPARPATSGSAVPRPDSGSARPSTGPVSPRPSGSPLSSGSSRVVMASNFLACVVGLALFL